MDSAQVREIWPGLLHDLIDGSGVSIAPITHALTTTAQAYRHSAR